MQLVENFSFYVTKHSCLEMLSPVCFSSEYSHSKDYSFSSFFSCFSPLINDFSVGTHVGYGIVTGKEDYIEFHFHRVSPLCPAIPALLRYKAIPVQWQIYATGESPLHIPSVPRRAHEDSVTELSFRLITLILLRF